MSKMVTHQSPCTDYLTPTAISNTTILNCQMNIFGWRSSSSNYRSIWDYTSSEIWNLRFKRSTVWIQIWIWMQNRQILVGTFPNSSKNFLRATFCVWSPPRFWGGSSSCLKPTRPLSRRSKNASDRLMIGLIICWRRNFRIRSPVRGSRFWANFCWVVFRVRVISSSWTKKLKVHV